MKHAKSNIALNNISSDYTQGVRVMANPLERWPRLVNLFE